MTITRKYTIEIKVEVSDEDGDLLEKLDTIYQNGAMAKIATTAAITALNKDGYKGLPRIVLNRQGITYGKGYNCDHVDRDSGNNTRENLVVKTVTENSKNKSNSAKVQSQYAGVWWYAARKKWYAKITNRKNGKQINCTGSAGYDLELDAAIWYDQKVRELGLTNKQRNFTDAELTALLAMECNERETWIQIYKSTTNTQPEVPQPMKPSKATTPRTRQHQNRPTSNAIGSA